MILQADEHSLYNPPTWSSNATGWSSATENLGKAYDYLASLTLTVEEEVSCLSRHYHGLRDMAHQRRLINAKTFVPTNTVLSYPDSGSSKGCLTHKLA